MGVFRHARVVALSQNSARRGGHLSVLNRNDFESLVRTHARVIGAAVRRVLGQRHRSLVPDAEQEVYLALWKALDGGRAIEHPSSYLYRAALHAALATLRRHAPAQETALPEEAAGRVPATPSPSAEEISVSRQLFELLPSEQRDAVKAYLAGFNHKEVAKLFGWSEAVARHRIYRGIESLKKSRKDDAA